MRQDLLALTIDDLVILSNRGIVKRSQQELQSGQLTYELNEDENGNVFVQWSDQIECRLPGDRALRDSICTCPATSLCRHLIRSVVVYQEPHNQQISAESTPAGATSETEGSSENETPFLKSQPASTAWNPGEITDKTLAQFLKNDVRLGCGVQLKHHSTELTAYCQDVDSGAIVALCRNFPDPPDSSEPAKDFSRLAQTSIIKGVGLAQLGIGQLLIKGGKRTPSYQFLPGRAPVSFNPRTYQWEMLRSSTLVEDFAELVDRLSFLPPASLRPRRLSENLFVCRVTTVEAASFNAIDQTVQATLRDRQRNKIRLIHPYTSRGQAGTEALLTALNQHPKSVEFLAGQVHSSSQGLVIAPISLVLQQSGSRIMLQPWIDSFSVALRADRVQSSPSYLNYLQELTSALSDLLTLGLQRVDTQTLRYWQELERQGAALGFVRLLKPIQQLATALAQKTITLDWSGQAAAEPMLTIALLVKLAQEQLGNYEVVAQGTT